jgi:C1A family cysteine protease
MKIFKFFSLFVQSVVIAKKEFLYADTLSIKNFMSWIEQYNISVINKEHMEQMYNNWFENDKFIEITNSKNLSYKVGHNIYSGLNVNEFIDFGLDINLLKEKNKYLRGNIPTVSQENIYDLNNLSNFVDWRNKNAVSNVKNQGSCGSCWSFSTTGALEGIYSIKYGNLVSFSEQQLIDCDNGIKKNHGCNGGLMDLAFDWINNNDGLCSENDYPYISGNTEKAETCKKTCKNIPNSKITKFTDIKPNSDEAMMNALVNQPVSVAINADQKSFQLYKSGVFTDTCGTNLNHGVLLVGYGMENGLDYYILKNSWGTSWGSSGFMYLGKGNDPSTGNLYNNGAGQCGVLSAASYPSL